MPELRWILLITGVVILIAIYAWGRRNARREPRREPVMRARAEPLIGVDERASSGEAAVHPEPDIIMEPEWPAQPRTLQQDLPPEEQSEPAPQRAASQRREPVVSSDFEADTTFTTGTSTQAESRAEVDDGQLIGATPVEAAEASPSQKLDRTRPSARAVLPRKIIVLRLAAPAAGFAGAKLQEALQGENLVFGKYDIFHRVDAAGATIFSVASMVEPGSFEPDRMSETAFPGMTLFAQLPGVLPGLAVFEELLECARNLQSVLEGTLQDDRGIALSTPRIQRLRQEIAEFETTIAQLATEHQA